MTALKIFVLRLGARLLGPHLSAMLMARTVDWGEMREGEPTVLCLNRPHFAKDVEELRKRTTLNWPTIKVVVLGFIQRAWLPEAFAQQTSFQKTMIPVNAGYWNKLRLFADTLLAEVEKRHKIDAIMIGHIDYWQGESIRQAAAERGIAYIVLGREHYYLPIQRQTAKQYYESYVFQGDMVGVMGEQTREVFVESGACKPEQVRVVGAPRFDAWRDRAADVVHDTIVLLSFQGPRYGVPLLFEEVLVAFVEEARAAAGTGVRFVVKAKDEADAAAVRSLVGELPANLSIVVDVAMRPLLQGARTIIGFNSLSLVEAMMTDARVCVPYWGESRALDPSLLVADPDEVDARQAIDWAEGPEALRAMLRETLRDGSELDPERGAARRRTVDRLIHVDPDVASSQLVAKMVVDAVARKRQTHGESGFAEAVK